MTTLAPTLLATTALLAPFVTEDEVTQAILDDPSQTTYVVVVLSDPGGTDLADRANQIEQARGSLLSTIPAGEFDPRYLYTNIPAFTGRTTLQGLLALRQSPVVRAIGLDQRGGIGLSQSVPYIEADEVHDLAITGEGTTIAVLDSGIDTDHPDLIDDVAPGAYHFLHQGSTTGPGAEDDHGHGTHVSGIITSRGYEAGYGVAPDAEILAVKVLDQNGHGWATDWIAGVDYVISVHGNYNNLVAINMSLGTDQRFVSCGCEEEAAFNMGLQLAIDSARGLGISTFVSAGNDQECDRMRSPACVSAALAVAAVEGPSGSGDTVTGFSNSSPANLLAAPGQWITSSALGGGTATWSGTSMAAPHCAGVAALIAQLKPQATAFEIAGLLMETGHSTQQACVSNDPMPIRVDAFASTFYDRRITQLIDAAGAGGNDELRNPARIAVDSVGTTYVSCTNEDKVFRILPNGAVDVVLDSSGDGQEHLYEPRSLVVDRWDNLYVAGLSSARVFKRTPGGTVSMILGPNGDGQTSFSAPTDLAIGPDGSVYIAGGYWDNVFRVYPNGSIDLVVDANGVGSADFEGPEGIAVDSWGRVYVCCEDSDNAFRIDPGGAVTLLIDDSVDSDFDRPRDIEVDHAGNVYVACGSPDIVFCITPAGQVSHLIDENGDGLGATLSWPTQLTLDRTGRVIVCGMSSNNLFRIDPHGGVELLIDIAGDGVHTFDEPQGVACDQFGNIFVAVEDSKNAFKIGGPWSGGGQQGVGSRYCSPAIANSTGGPASIHASGSSYIALNDVLLTATDLPTNMFAMAINSMDQGASFPPDSQGRLCVGGSIGRHKTQIQNSGSGGMVQITVDLSDLPTAAGSYAVQPGETWNFQVWFRDFNPDLTNNFTDAISLTFQ